MSKKKNASAANHRFDGSDTEPRERAGDCGSQTDGRSAADEYRGVHSVGAGHGSDGAKERGDDPLQTANRAEELFRQAVAEIRSSGGSTGRA